MLIKFEGVDNDFKTHHLALMGLLDDNEVLEREQEALDEHDDEITTLTVRIKKLASSNDNSDVDSCKVVARRLNRIKRSLSAVGEQITDMASRPSDVCLIKQHEEQLLEIKKELSETSNSLLLMDLEDSDDLMEPANKTSSTTLSN